VTGLKEGTPITFLRSGLSDHAWAETGSWAMGRGGKRPQWRLSRGSDWF